MADEKKYIEQGAALDAVFGQFCASSDETERALNAAIEEIKLIPAADVAPVRHGKWDCFIDFVTCSLCGYTSTDTDNHGDPVSLNYCPFCGAKMENYRDV